MQQELEQPYLDLVKEILTHGARKTDRTGTGTLSLFGKQLRFDLSEGFPLLTTKAVSFKNIAHELIWFMSGQTHVKYLHDNGVHIWDEWVKEDGTIGEGYGKQWRSWQAADGSVVDQLSDVVNQIKTNPDSRRLIVSAWNVGELKGMALPPCHLLFQFYVNNGALSCQLYQRSADMGLGVPYNIASYSLLTMLIAAVCELNVGEFIWTGGDCHIYSNHVEQLNRQLTRTPYAAPKLFIDKRVRSLYDFKLEHLRVVNYISHPFLKMDVAV